MIARILCRMFGHHWFTGIVQRGERIYPARRCFRCDRMEFMQDDQWEPTAPKGADHDE